MIIELIIALIVGVMVGTFTGITPGIHINLVSALLLATTTTFLLGIQPLALVIFLVAVAITHTFVDFVPSIFLGAPDEDNFLSILPGHQMLIKGNAYSAVILTLYGSLIAIGLILILTPLFLFFLSKVYPYAQIVMPYILLIACFFLIYFEKNNRLMAIIIFLLAGFLGYATLNLPIKENLLPMFTGLFGISSLITSIVKKQKIPSQKIIPLKNITLPKKSFLKAISASIIASPLCSFLPGLGSGQAAVIGSEVIGELNQKEFLILLGAVNTLVVGLSFITLYTINRTRTGVAVAISKLIDLTLGDIYVIIATIAIVGLLSFFITIKISKLFARRIDKINYRNLSLIIIAILVAIILFFTGWLGLLVALISSCLGLTCILLGIRRTHLMGCLLIPALLFYL